MRIFLMFCVLVPAALVLGWLAYSKVRSRFLDQDARLREVHNEQELTEGEIRILEAGKRLEETKESLRIYEEDE